MKNIAIIAIALLTANAHAASSGTLFLQGTVPSINDITVVPNGSNNTALDILNGETNKNVATVTEVSNDALGYKIFISSLNGGELRLAGNPSQKTTYTISYDGGAAAQPGTVAAQAKNVSSLSSTTTHNSAVLVNVVASPNAVAGTYSDPVPLAIVAN